MDDIYQYTASAVNNNNNNNNINENDQQNDPLIQAFTNFGWGQRFSSLMDTVKKQSEVIVDVTKKDLQEFANILREDSNELVDQLSQSTTSTATITNNNNDEPNQQETTSVETHQSTRDVDNENNTNNTNSIYASSIASLREGLGKINTVNLKALREGLTDTLQNQPFLPSQLTSIKLPDNINLGELRQELDQGTRFAELYMQKFGAEVIQVLNRTITVLEPDVQEDNQQSQQEENTSQSNTNAPRIFANRTEALIAKLQTDHDILLADPKDILMANQDSDQIKLLETFNSGFNVQEYTSEIARLLDDSPDLRQTMDDLVPLKVDYTTFWQRYFYHSWKIDQEEQRRQLIVKGAEHDEDDFRWDSDDEDTNYQKAQTNDQNNNTSSTKKNKDKAVLGSSSSQILDETNNDTNKSDTDFSNISEPPSTEASLVSPPLKSETDADDWVKTSTEEERKKQSINDNNNNNNNNDDSDSDWE
ncbi:uncharacterized protein BX664DRAFT_387919 [Halteromyces radiatus]|uniref:uncharacterized protein n=1 Tax=Halteromyces radiatus TaxID=101107 RepID=UPI00221EC37B|nr:uncharacterized protein BX664DRAFT_387919 [Halteromyces radiatus]KAI8082773.1 hypothetical protein BX664DRAFT_387919 [Halteromyces radiatus]